MEHIHAQSYSQIFQTLATTSAINEAFRWSRDNDFLQEKVRILQEVYAGNEPLKKKVISVLLESFLFYSGFYRLRWLNGNAKLTNTADVISYKFQRSYERLSESERDRPDLRQAADAV